MAAVGARSDFGDGRAFVPIEVGCQHEPPDDPRAVREASPGDYCPLFEALFARPAPAS